MTEKLNMVDKLFESYNYKIAKNSTTDIRIYTLQYGMYHAAEIISFDENTDVSKFKNELSDLGYATDLKVVKNLDEVEEYLFEGFFIKTPLGNELKNRYKNFVRKQLLNLPEGSNYQYIDSDFDLIVQNKLGEITEAKSYSSKENSIISKINDLFTQTRGALFIIIEAPAGFGKTCTANEILNSITLENSNKLPFFTELSRNREARVFKHILLNEIDEQFPNGIKQNVVLEQIYKGRIPLIIDGFDELITKDSNKEDVESMLSTIVDLLQNDAKIVITSRKTAILNSDEFIETINSSIEDFSLARFEIKEPTIENWLHPERTKFIEENGFPINQISNPVLLSYLRNIPMERLKDFLTSKESTLIDKYFDYLLTRERTRQNLKLDNQAQFRIFRKLNRFMCEYNFTAETKETIKDFIKDYNIKILQETIKEYKSEEKPSIEELTETLSNHVFLDRKTDGNVGFINEFIFGFLVSENLILEKFQEHYKDKFSRVIPQDFAQISIEASKIQSTENKFKLWTVYNSYDFGYDSEFYFDADYFLQNEIKRNFSQLFLADRNLKDLSFQNYIFENCVFAGITFENCTFSTSSFKKSSFQNCKFYNCILESRTQIIYEDFGIYVCQDNNDFLRQINSLYCKDNDENKVIKQNELTEQQVLHQFLQVDSKRPKPRKFSVIKLRLNEYSDKEINTIIDSLIRKEFLHFKDDVGFITREAMNYLNHNNQ
ncbi:NACHT domain-containing protein [Flavobacterium sp. S87F.05.LMB.W.Kidney.N]|uniref:NACHT domain-containing protein n=1 Tax=Flavobacterium sp. S87F.05.LMB.W.Kidney.N TaxID=1278758 RepID=UPI0010648E3D|nr:NACHT domain-containing protein [Flavobacterium sp. S87F.05.LMB.W.Kidney.N]TDX11466.1 pentapeptide repeat protein [Flavobacterium sp. S87F.05.LMB.W.Kidney.N]